MIILGIDPGTTRVGYGVIQTDGGPRFIAAGVIGREGGKNHEKLVIIERGLARVIKKYRPRRAAVEKLYFSKNRKTAMAVAEARGVILLTLAKNKISIREFDPTEVKATVAGSGRADKATVQEIVSLRLGLSKFKALDDAWDALALAIRASLDNR